LGAPAGGAGRVRVCVGTCGCAAVGVVGVTVTGDWTAGVTDSLDGLAAVAVAM